MVANEEAEQQHHTETTPYWNFYRFTDCDGKKTRQYSELETYRFLTISTF